MLVGEGRLALDAPPGVPGWTDERAAITLDQLLQMRDGLEWAEDYVDAGVSDVIEMLFGAGQDDVAAYAEARPLAHPPGHGLQLLVGHVEHRGGDRSAATVGAGDAVAALPPRPGAAPDRDALGRPAARRRRHVHRLVATSTPPPRTGPGSAPLHLRDGVWDGERILPEGWVDHGRRVRSVDPTDGSLYGAHWWIDQLDLERGTFRASGYEGQAVAICPALDAVVVRLGKTLEPPRRTSRPGASRLFDALEHERPRVCARSHDVVFDARPTDPGWLHAASSGPLPLAGRELAASSTRRPPGRLDARELHADLGPLAAEQLGRARIGTAVSCPEPSPSTSPTSVSGRRPGPPASEPQTPVDGRSPASPTPSQLPRVSGNSEPRTRFRGRRATARSLCDRSERWSSCAAGPRWGWGGEPESWRGGGRARGLARPSRSASLASRSCSSCRAFSTAIMILFMSSSRNLRARKRMAAPRKLSGVTARNAMRRLSSNARRWRRR